MSSFNSSALLLGFFLCLTCFSCQRENMQVMDDTFIPYVDLFFEEAQKRNYELRKEDFDFSMHFGSIANAAGLCSYANNEITINPNYWHDRNEIGKQYLVFHELGHCILDRRHDNGILEHGECKSIMKGTEDGRRCLRSLVSDIWREYYVDELFSPQTRPPTWYIDQVETQLEKEILNFEDSTTTLLRSSTFDLNPEENFEIIASFEKAGHLDPIEMTWGEFGFSFGGKTGLITISDQPTYYHVAWTTYAKTSLHFVQQDDFHYFLVDGKMFHMDRKSENPFSSVRLELDPSSNSPNIKISLQVNQLK